jgi:hypothetical protein
VSSQPTPAPATKNSTSATVLQSDPALLSPSFSAPSASSAFSPSRPAHSPSYQRPRKRFQVRRQPSGWLSLGPSNFFLGTCCPSAHHVLSSPLRRRRRTGRYPPRPRSRPG